MPTPTLQFGKNVNVPKGDYFNAIGYKPHSDLQWEVHNSNSRFKVTVCGRRWGKSTWSGHELSYEVFNPINAGNIYWIVGPTYELGEREFEVVWDDIMLKLGLLNYPGIEGSYSVQAGNMKIKMPWGTFLKVASADKPKSLLGKGLSGVIMSEPASHNPETWDKYIRPALADKHGFAYFPGTPEGFNWLYELYLRGKDVEKKAWRSWKAPAWTNPLVYPGGRDDPEIEEIEENSSKMWFDQEIGAEFTTFEGQIYPEFSYEHHVLHDIQYVPGYVNFWAIDFGWSADWICLDVMIDGMENVYVWREYVEHYKSTYTCAEELRFERENPTGFKLAAVFCDPNDPGEKDTLQLGLKMPVYAEKGDWSRQVEEIKRKMKIRDVGAGEMKPKFFVSDNCPQTIKQLQMLTAKPQTQHDRNPKVGQKDWFDHAPDALRYLFHHVFVLGHGSKLRDAYRLDSNDGGTGNNLNDRPSKKGSLTSFRLADAFINDGGGKSIGNMRF